MMDYERIVELAKSTGRTQASFVVLSEDNDPYFAGRPAHMRAARWFADLYQRFGFSAGIHLRRVHYVLASQKEPVLMLDGSAYENTNACWKKLSAASKDARYNHLVDVEDFTDRRNPEVNCYLPDAVEEPSIHVEGDGYTEADAEADAEADTDDDLDEAILPWISQGVLPWVQSAILPEIKEAPRMTIVGECPMPFHVEIWTEKSTVNDIIMPLAEHYGLNFQGNVGETSLTLCRDLAERVRANGNRPARILYISDFDVAGQSMPVAAARKLQWLLDESGEGLDIQLHPIVLNLEQCIEYQLPRTPYNDTDRRAARFEAKYGEGRTELDALEALHPGELRKILVQEIERFHDPDAIAAWEEKMNDAQESLDEIRDDVVAAYRGKAIEAAARMDGLKEQIKAIEEEERTALRARLAGLSAQVMEIQEGARVRLAARLEGFGEQFEAIQEEVSARNDEIREKLEDAKPDVEDLDLEPRGANEWDDPLFDSERDYREQVFSFKQHQGKD